MHGVFLHIEAFCSLKNAWLPQIVFWIARVLANFWFLRIVLNRAKISLHVLVGTTHRTPKYLDMG